MKPSDDLFQLIKSLSPNEKRYFKLFMTRNKEGKRLNSLRLFDAINQMEVYEEELIQQQFKGETFIKYLSAEKNNLYGAILKTMQHFAAQPSVHTRIHNLIEQSVFLRDKGLYDQSEKVLKKAKGFALEQEAFHWLSEISLQERWMVKKRGKGSVEKKMKVLWQEAEEVQIKLNEIWTVSQLFDQLLITARRDYRVKDKEKQAAFREIMDHPLLQSEKELLTFTGKIYANQIKGFYAQLQGENESSFTFFSEACTIWEAHPEHIMAGTYTYRLLLANYLHSAFEIERFDIMRITIDRLNELPAQNWNEAAETFQNAAFFELLLLINTNQLEQAAAKVPEIEKGLLTFQRKINKARMVAFYYNILIIYFVLENHTQANKWVRKILDLPASDFRRDIRRVALVFSMLIQFDLGNRDSIESLFRAAHRTLKREEALSPAYALFLAQFRKVIKQLGGPKEKEAFLKLLREMRKNNTAGELEKELGIKEILAWIESTATNASRLQLLFPASPATSNPQ